MERIEIFTSKKKNIFLLFLVIIFLAVGIFSFLNANELSNDGKRSIVFIEVISIIVVIFALIALFQELEIKGNKSILIQVRNPETLIANEKNFFVKKMMQWSQKMYGAPISIASSTMKISHKELVSLLLVSFATYKDKN